MKLVFCGTPAFAVPTLNALLRAGHQVDLVVTQPDRPQGRAMTLAPPPVKIAAQAAGLTVVQPEKIRNNAGLREQLEAISPDAIIVVAYGRIIPKWMIDLPPHGNLNLHGSLLPRYRGAAPIQWAIANGETVIGATTMRIDEGLDTGDMLLQRELPIGPDQTAEEAFPLLAAVGAELMIETLDLLQRTALPPRKQDESLATLAPILKREDGEIDFDRTATEIYNRWRGFQPWPGAYTRLDGKKLTIHRMRLAAAEVAEVPGATGAQEPADMRAVNGKLLVTCGKNTCIEVTELQLEGRKQLAAGDFLRGFRIADRVRLG